VEDLAQKQLCALVLLAGIDFGSGPKAEHHVYYRFDGDRDLLVIYSVWGARRGRGPKL
jgi:hypothetical protein